MNINYYNLKQKTESKNIDLIFENWQGSEEKVVVYAPHDDDGFLGPGYVLTAAQKNGAECFVFIICNGCGGYSDPEQKESIIEIRKNETKKAYANLGIDEEHIIRFEYPDFSANTRIGWQLINGKRGSITKALPRLREIGVTRLLIPNGYREHLDHEAVSKMGSYHAPQVGDPVLVDWGVPTEVKTVLEYSVWGDFSPEDSLVDKRSTAIRANFAVKVGENIEEKIREAIKEYKSQAQIIDDLVRRREERKVGDGYIELYRGIDPRPILDYGPYVEYIKNEF